MSRGKAAVRPTANARRTSRKVAGPALPPATAMRRSEVKLFSTSGCRAGQGRSGQGGQEGVIVVSGEKAGGG